MDFFFFWHPVNVFYIYYYKYIKVVYSWMVDITVSFSRRHLLSLSVSLSLSLSLCLIVLIASRSSHKAFRHNLLKSSSSDLSVCLAKNIGTVIREVLAGTYGRSFSTILEGIVQARPNLLCRTVTVTHNHFCLTDLTVITHDAWANRDIYT